MKKFFLIAAAAALVLSSCSKNTVSEDTSDVNAIGFGTYSGTSTKAGSSLVNSTSLTPGTSFGVYGYLTAGTEWSSTATTGFMPNQKVDFTSESKYVYTPVRYWPKDESNLISFYGYYPYSESAGDNGITADFTSSNVGIYAFAVASAPASQVDFMISDFAKNLTYSNAKTNTSSSADGSVKLTFHHMLTKIGMKVKTTADANTTVKITSITFGGHISNSGKLSPAETATNSEWNSLSGSAIYTMPLNAASVTLGTGADYADLCATATNANAGDLMMIPQTLSSTDGDNVITISYDYTTNGYTVHDKAIADLKGQIWGMNNYIIYKLNLDLASREIKFEATIAPWDDASEITL